MYFKTHEAKVLLFHNCCNVIILEMGKNVHEHGKSYREQFGYHCLLKNIEERDETTMRILSFRIVFVKAIAIKDHVATHAKNVKV